MRYQKEIKIPEAGHPFTKWFFGEVSRQQKTVPTVADRTGVNPQSIHNWRRHQPTLPLLDAALQAIGFRLAIVPINHPAVPDWIDHYTAVQDEEERKLVEFMRDPQWTDEQRRRAAGGRHG